MTYQAQTHIKERSKDTACSSAPLPSVWAEVILGVLRKDCRGLGVCKIVPDHSITARCSVTRVLITKLHDCLLRFRFDRQLLCPWQLRHQFMAGRFTMEADFGLPDFLLEALELQANLVPAGEYIIHTDGRYFDVYFSLRHSLDIE